MGFDLPQGARLDSLWTYPVKGGPGRSLERADIGQDGLPGDRRRAVPSGRLPLAGTGWVSRRAFRNLAQDLTLKPWTAPLVDRGVPLWDFPDTSISIINLATVEDLADVLGGPVDPRRFRANLVLDGLPAWAELELPGRRLRIGGAELEVLRPIERCRATTVNPDTRQRDLRLPALLQGHFGHLNFGLYARVRVPGPAQPGDPVRVVGTSELEAEPGWPRRVEVVQRVDEAPGVLSLWLSDPTGLAHRARPGQHVRIISRDEQGPVWRCFTISGTEPDRFRITVRRHSRMGDRLLADELTATGPHGAVTLGDGTLHDSTEPVLLATAGIGITPAVAMLRALVERPRPVRLIHVARGPDVPLWPEVQALCSRIPDARVRLVDTTVTGRPDPAAVAELAAEGVAEAFVCGPEGFSALVVGALTAAGVQRDHIRRERFYSPALPDAEDRPAPLPGPFPVTFGDLTATWTPSDGTLLDLGDGAGVNLPSGCRSGVCGECSQRLRSGQVSYVTDPVIPPDDGEVLLCCAVPVSQVEVSADPG